MPEESPIVLPDLSVWDMAPTAIDMWSNFGDQMLLFQVLLVLFLGGSIAMMLVRLSNEISAND